MNYSKPPYDEIDISSAAFWSLDATARDASFAALRSRRQVSWHQPLVETSRRHSSDDEGFWALVKHGDIVKASGMPEVFLGEDLAVGDVTRCPLSLDPRRVQRLEARIRNQAKRIVDAVTPLGSADFVEAVSSRLAGGAVAEMFGVPEELRQELAGAASGTETFVRSLKLLQAHAESLVDARRSQPRDDVLTALVTAKGQDRRLTDEEVGKLFMQTWVLTSEFTRQTASHAMKALCDFPDQRRLLMSDFESRIYPAIEEFLRWASPAITSRRRAVVDVEIGGRLITAGDVVLLVYSSGNRDQEVFREPRRFQVTRAPNAHVAFGCVAPGLGHRLVRTQLQALFTELLYRLPDLRVRDAQHGTGSLLHSIECMPVTFTPVGVAVPAPRGERTPAAEPRP